jgi:hypothetical protein
MGTICEMIGMAIRRTLVCLYPGWLLHPRITLGAVVIRGGLLLIPKNEISYRLRCTSLQWIFYSLKERTARVLMKQKGHVKGRCDIFNRELHPGFTMQYKDMYILDLS